MVRPRKKIQRSIGCARKLLRARVGNTEVPSGIFSLELRSWYAATGSLTSSEDTDAAEERSCWGSRLSFASSSCICGDIFVEDDLIVSNRFVSLQASSLDPN